MQSTRCLVELSGKLVSCDWVSYGTDFQVLRFVTFHKVLKSWNPLTKVIVHLWPAVYSHNTWLLYVMYIALVLRKSPCVPGLMAFLREIYYVSIAIHISYPSYQLVGGCQKATSTASAFDLWPRLLTSPRNPPANVSQQQSCTLSVLLSVVW